MTIARRSAISAVVSSVALGVPTLAIALALFRGLSRLPGDSLAGAVSESASDASIRGLALAVPVGALSVTLALGVSLGFFVLYRSSAHLLVARLFSVSSQFLSPLLFALGWLLIGGWLGVPPSRLLIVTALSGMLIPSCVVVLDTFLVARLAGYLDTAATLGASPWDQMRLALRLGAPTLVAASVVTIAWAYTDAVAIGLLSGGGEFYPGTLVTYLLQQSGLSDLAYIAILPSLAAAALISMWVSRRA